MQWNIEPIKQLQRWDKTTIWDNRLWWKGSWLRGGSKEEKTTWDKKQCEETKIAITKGAQYPWFKMSSG